MLRNQRFHLLVDFVETVSQESNCCVDVPPSRSHRRHSSVSLCDDHFDELPMTCHEMTDLFQLLVRNGTHRRLHSFAEMCEDLRINRICFGELSNGPCKVPHLSRVHNGDG